MTDTSLLMDVVVVVVKVVAVLVFFLVFALVAGQTEHKLMAHMQGRLGPMYAGGYHGWAQLLADAVKFAQKEKVTPSAVDKHIFSIAPAFAMIPYMLALAAIPLSPTIVAAKLDAGVLYVLAASAIGVLGGLTAGWSSGNKYALIGSLRGAAQLLAYELPMVLAASSVAMAAGTLSLIGIAEAWTPWWLIWQLPAAVIFFVAGLAELQRPPFDTPLADTEIVVGPIVEYSGMRFALFLFAEYAGMVVLGLLMAVLFLGAWHGPFSAQLGWLWTLLKAGLVVCVIIWFRVAWPRVRTDQLQKLAWTILVPVGLAQLALTAVLVVVGVLG